MKGQWRPLKTPFTPGDEVSDKHNTRVSRHRALAPLDKKIKRTLPATRQKRAFRDALGVRDGVIRAGGVGVDSSIRVSIEEVW